MRTDMRLFPQLTDREEEILALVAQGKSNRTIAHHLQISESTVQNHVHSLLRKLGVQNRTEASSLYWRNLHQK